MKLLRSLFFLAAVSLSLPSAASAAVVNYTFEGSTTNALGRFAGGPFFYISSFTFTLSGNTGGIQTNFPYLSNSVTGSGSLITSDGNFNFTLTPDPGQPIAVGMLDTGFGYQYVLGMGGSLSDGIHLGSLSGPSDLETYGSYSGDSLAGFPSFSTDAGILEVIIGAGTGTFTVSPAAVPEPATATASLLLSLAGLSLISRRNRRA